MLPRREAVARGGIDAAIGAAIFLVPFGPDRPADLGAFASDLLPQAFGATLAAIVTVAARRRLLAMPEILS